MVKKIKEKEKNMGGGLFFKLIKKAVHISISIFSISSRDTHHTHKGSWGIVFIFMFFFFFFIFFLFFRIEF